MSKFLDLMLRPDVPSVQKELPKKRVKIKRLTRLVGEDVCLELQGLPYGKAQELKEMANDQEVMILLAGCPELKDPQLMSKYGVPTPAEAVKELFTPGEIADLSRTVEKLSGYRQSTIEEIKNV